METKLAKLKAAARRGDWRKAIAIAARFPRLGEHRQVITRAHGCYNDPDFYAQLGYDTDACIEAGIAALVANYNLTETQRRIDMTAKTYSTKSNAAKAARTALNNPDAKHGVDFMVFEQAGRYGFELEDNPKPAPKVAKPKKAQVQPVSVKAQRMAEAAAKANGPRPGSKTEITFQLMQRPEGCTQAESAEAGGLNESLNDVVARFAEQYGFAPEKVKDGRRYRYCLRAK